MFRAANIGSSFKTVRDRHMVIMKHYWEVDVGLSESAKNLTLDDLEMTPEGQPWSKVKMHLYYLGNGEHYCL